MNSIIRPAPLIKINPTWGKAGTADSREIIGQNQ